MAAHSPITLDIHSPMKNCSTRPSAYCGTAIPTNVEIYDVVTYIVDLIERKGWEFFVHEDFEDLRNDAYMRVTERIGKYNPAKGKFGPWAYSVVLNLICDAYKRKLKERGMFVPYVCEDDEGDEYIPSEVELYRSNDFRPDREVETAFHLERIEGAIDDLPCRMQTVVNLIADGNKRREVAKILGVTPNAVGMLYNRSRKVLREVLSDILSAA